MKNDKEKETYQASNAGKRKSLLRDILKKYFGNNPKKIPYKVGEVVAIAQSYKDIFSAFSQHHNSQLNICVKIPPIQLDGITKCS